MEIKYDKVQNLSHEGGGDTFLLLRAADKDPEYFITLSWQSENIFVLILSIVEL